MFTNNFDPVALSFFIIDIRWYSISYILGIFLGWIYIVNLKIKNHTLRKAFDSYLSYLIIGIIIGGRLGYVMFYDFNYYIINPQKILYIWQGGMSFHGGVIGVIISTYIFCKIYKMNTFFFLDLVSISSPIGIFFGRIANFINSELYGKETNVPWSVKFVKVDDLNRHPSQIYEAIFEGLILFILLNYLYKFFLKIPGKTSAIFLITYSIFRFFIEFTREPDSQIGLIFDLISMWQIISIATLLAGFLLIFYLNNENVK